MLSFRTTGAVCEAQLDGLKDCVHHMARVRAVSPLGPGTWSPEAAVQATRVSPPSAPGKPQACLSSTPGSCDLTWSAPLDDGGSPIQRYLLHAVAQAPSMGTTLFFETPSGMHSNASSGYTFWPGFVEAYSAHGLKPGVEYAFRVQAVSSVGAGDLSEYGNVVKPKAPILEPPSHVHVEDVSPSSVVLVWAPPANGAGVVLRYRIMVEQIAPERFPPAIHETPGPLNYLSLTLPTSGRYAFWVSSLGAGESGGISPRSIASSAAVASAEVVVAEVGCPGTPTPVEITHKGVRLIWASSGDKADQYEVLIFEAVVDSANDGIQPFASSRTPMLPGHRGLVHREILRASLQPSHMVCGLPPGASLRARVRALVAGAAPGPCSAASEVFSTPLGPPDPPASPAVGAVGVSTRAMLQWQPPECSMGPPVLEYAILIKRVSIVHQTSEKQDASGGSDSANHAMRDGSVDATAADSSGTDGGEGARGGGVAGKLATFSGLGDSGTNDSGTSLGAGNSDIANTGMTSGPVSGYFPMEEWEARTGAPRPIHTVTGLEPGAAYVFRVKTITAAGESAPSKPSSIFYTGPRPPGAPGRPWLYGPHSTEPYDPVIAFTGPTVCDPSAPVESFRCIAFVKGRPEVTAEVQLMVVGSDGNVITATAAGLQASGEYQFAVQACNAGGWGPLGLSSPPALIWRPCAPGRPRITDVNVSNGSVRLKWVGSYDQHAALIIDYTVHIRRLANADGEPEAVCTWPTRATLISPLEAEDNHAATPVEELGDGDAEEVCSEVPGLECGFAYSFCVSAASGDQPWPVSEESESVELPAGVPSAPGMPECFLDPAQSTDRQKVRVEWKPSVTDSAAPILGYRVHIYRLNKSAFETDGDTAGDMPMKPPWAVSVGTRGVAVFNTSTGSTAARPVSTVCPVEPGAQYCFEVQAMNCRGTSMLSPRSAPLSTSYVAPSPCRSLAVRTIGDSAACLCWQPPARLGGLPLTGYRIIVSLNLNEPGTEATVEENRSSKKSEEVIVAGEGAAAYWMRHVVSALQLGVDYNMRVCAFNEAGESTAAEANWRSIVPA